MKVKFNGEDFKKAIERAGAVIPKKSPVPILECVRIEANSCGGKFTLFATNMEAFVSVDVPAEIMEDGIVYAVHSDLKKIAAIPGTVALEVADGKIIAANEKKKSSIPHTQYTDGEYIFPGKVESILMESTENEIITTLAELSSFVLDDGGKNAITSTFHLDGVNNRMYALDGHKVAVKKTMFAAEKEVAIPCGSYAHLKKITRKSDDTVKVYSDGKYVMFSGEDFEYTTRVVEKATGQYSIDRLFNCFQPDAEFTFSAEEMGKLAKEYGKITKESPMYISFGVDTINTGVMLPDFTTSDKLDATCKNADGVLYAVNPSFVRDAMDLFGGKITASFERGKGFIQKKQILIEDDTYKVIILPIACSEEKAEAFVKFAN